MPEKLPDSFKLLSSGNGVLILEIHGRMDSESAGCMLRGVKILAQERPVSSLTVDMSAVSYFDDFGVLILLTLREAMEKAQAEFHVRDASEPIQALLSLYKLDEIIYRGRLGKRSNPDILTRLGGGFLALWQDLLEFISFVGSACLAFLAVIRRPSSLRKGDTLLTMQKTGVDALPIVGLISLLLGMILAFMSSVQLKQFGADIYVASLVSLAMVRELGPVMTAIIVAGRSGSAFAAEIGTMKVSEEVDALFTMGFDPTRFLVVPKMIAIAFMTPFLTLFADLFAIVGGLLVATTLLDLTIDAYISETIRFLGVKDIIWTFIKSVSFAFLIAWIGCLRGFQVRGGADSVGRATTSAVVSSIFLIIIADSVFAVIRVYWG